jgi:hypothetical protein
MAKVESTTITTTAACDLGDCRSCRGVVFSLTDAHLTDCAHECHLDEIEDEEVAGDLVADLALEREYEDRVWGWS